MNRRSASVCLRSCSHAFDAEAKLGFWGLQRKVLLSFAQSICLTSTGKATIYGLSALTGVSHTDSEVQALNRVKGIPRGTPRVGVSFATPRYCLSSLLKSMNRWVS